MRKFPAVRSPKCPKISCNKLYPLLSGYLLEPRLCCERTSRDVFWSYIIMANLFIVLLIEYVSSIRSSI